MAFTKEQILEGYRKSRLALKSVGDKTKLIDEDKIIKWNKVEFDLKKGWRVADLDDETIAKIMHMENLTFKAYAKGEITFQDIDKITTEVFND